MLKNVPACLSPDILKALSSIGHASKILIADGNCDIYSLGRPNCFRVRADGVSGSELLKAILKMIHVDVDVDDPIRVNKPGPEVETPACYASYDKVVKESDEFDRIRYGGIHYMGNEFWQDCMEYDLIIASGERSLYGNIYIQKGVVYPNEAQ